MWKITFYKTDKTFVSDLQACPSLCHTVRWVDMFKSPFYVLAYWELILPFSRVT